MCHYGFLLVVCLLGCVGTLVRTNDGTRINVPCRFGSGIRIRYFARSSFEDRFAGPLRPFVTGHDGLREFRDNRREGNGRWVNSPASRGPLIAVLLAEYSAKDGLKWFPESFVASSSLSKDSVSHLVNDR